MATDHLPIFGELLLEDALPAELDAGDAHRRALDVLARIFAIPFGLWDARRDCWLCRPDDQPACDATGLIELFRTITERSRPEIIAYEEPLAVLALPLPGDDDTAVAVSAFLTRPLGPGEDVSVSAASLGLEPGRTTVWAWRQNPWHPDALVKTAGLAAEHLAALRRMERLEDESQNLSANLASTYEEITLLYRLTQNLKLSHSDTELGQVAMEWMEEVVPAEGFALQLLPVADGERSLAKPPRTQAELVSFGCCALDNEAFARLIDYLRFSERIPDDFSKANQPVVINRNVTAAGDWPFDEIRELIAVPLVEGENTFGWLAALNHVDGGEFGTVEASLVSSVAAILGIHSGNIELYRQQEELLAGVVRALSSAIDAKDPYTCGHSDRVARISVRLAQEMDCDAEAVKKIYLSGLLHDVGKIGVDDHVLRKPDKLSDEEYEHIKSHVTTGHRILSDLRKMGDVLPVVLHHHESWDGRGYPSRLLGDEIPLAARIVAVADSFDAMGSNRPYRRGMPDEKIDAILRSGAGKQWDPAVVDAFFRCRDDVRHIAEESVGAALRGGPSAGE